VRGPIFLFLTPNFDRMLLRWKSIVLSARFIVSAICLVVAARILGSGKNVQSLLPTTRFHHKLFAALFAWLAR